MGNLLYLSHLDTTFLEATDKMELDLVSLAKAAYFLMTFMDYKWPCL